MAVYIPSFANFYPKPGANAPSTSAIAFTTAGDALSRIGGTIAGNIAEKQSLERLADELESTSPDVAAIVRSEASGITPFSGIGGSLSPAGRGGSGGGGGGFGSRTRGLVAEALLKKLEDDRVYSQRLDLENTAHRNSLSRIQAQTAAQDQLIGARENAEIRVAEAKRQIDASRTPEERAAAERSYKIEETRLQLEEERLRQGARKTNVEIQEEIRQTYDAIDRGIPLPTQLSPTGEALIDTSLFPTPAPTEKKQYSGLSKAVTRTELQDEYVAASDERKVKIAAGVGLTLMREGAIPKIDLLSEEGRAKLAEAGQQYILGGGIMGGGYGDDSLIGEDPISLERYKSLGERRY